MFDYSSTTKPAARASFRSGLSSRTARRVGKPAKNKVAVTSKLATSFMMLIKAILIWAVGGSAVTIISFHLALKFVLPALFPLTAAQTFLFVPNDVAQTSYTVALINPIQQSVTLATVEKEAVKPLTGNLSLPEVNQQLGKIIDQIFFLPSEQKVTNQSTLQHTLGQLISQKTFGLSRSEKLKIWLFTQSLPSSQVYMRNIDTVDAWQKFMSTTAAQTSFKSCSIALINRTKKFGLGKNISQLLEQSGYQIIKVDSQSESLPKSQLYVAENKPTCQKYAERISKSVVTQPQIITDSFQPNIHRADIVLFLGEDVGELLAAPAVTQ